MSVQGEMATLQCYYGSTNLGWRPRKCKEGELMSHCKGELTPQDSHGVEEEKVKDSSKMTVFHFGWLLPIREQVRQEERHECILDHDTLEITEEYQDEEVQ